MLTQSRRTVDRARQTVDEASALVEASGWPGPPVLRDLDDSLADRRRVELTEFAEGPRSGRHGLGNGGGEPRRARLLPGRAGATATGSSSRPLGTAAWSGRERCSRSAASTSWTGRFRRHSSPAVGVEADLAGGFVFEPGRLAVATEEDLFGSRRHTRDAPRIAARRADAIAQELSPGDYAVHRVHGVGRYVGITHRAVAAAERDYMVLDYAEGDRLFVPTDQVGMVAKYVGGESPRLHRLGSSDWARAKSRVKRAVKDMAGELVRLYSVRMSVAGHAFAPDTPWQRELEDAFPYDETRDQLTTIDEVKRDMERPKPMDRLICGDVGYGKTEIAVRAAFKAVMDGKQVAVLVPTTLLAEQHAVTFSERYAPFPVKVAMLSVPLRRRAEAGHRRCKKGRGGRRHRDAQADLQRRHLLRPRTVDRR